jgi:ribosome-associated translation inhibitor RaiA
MQIRISAPGNHLTEAEVEAINHDLEKIDRRLADFKEEVVAEVRVRQDGSAPDQHVVIELDYGRTHLIAKADHSDVGQAVRVAREELLRQINDRSKRGHSSFSKGYQAGRTP